MAASHLAGLDQRMLGRLRQLRLPAGAAIGVAFSGGNDSLALAIALSRCAPAADVHPILMHIDHQLRPESGADLERCIELAGLLELPIQAGTLPPKMSERTSGSGIEQQARIERYQLLSKLCHQASASILATGHHLDDQAETVLLHLFRGSGLTGVAGMQERGPLPIDQPNVDGAPVVEVWRPFLTETRKTLEAYVAAAGLEPVTDRSNEDVAFRRNAVRHDILPKIESHFSGAAEAISRFAHLVQEDARYLDEAAATATMTMKTVEGALKIDRLLSEPPPIAGRVVRRWLAEAGVAEPTAERIGAVLDFASTGPDDARLEVGSDRSVVRHGNRLLAGLPNELIAQLVAEANLLYAGDDHDIQAATGPQGGRELDAPDWILRITESVDTPGAGGSAETEIDLPTAVALDKIEGRVVRRGDRMFASGREVRELLRTAGVHPLARRHVACLVIDDEVVAIPGYSRIDDGRSTAGRDSRRVLIDWRMKERQR